MDGEGFAELDGHVSHIFKKKSSRPDQKTLLA